MLASHYLVALFDAWRAPRARHKPDSVEDCEMRYYEALQVEARFVNSLLIGVVAECQSQKAETRMEQGT